MNKREAIQAMLNGEKVRHASWGKGEYIFADERGDIINEDMGWFNLNNELFNCWEIYKLEPKFKVGEFVTVISSGNYYRIRNVNFRDGKYCYELLSDKTAIISPLFRFEEQLGKVEDWTND